MLDLVRGIDAHRDIRRLAVDRVEDAAGIAVETVFRTVVPDAAHDVAHDVVHVHVRVRADFAADHDHAGRGHGLARAAHGGHVRRLAGRIDIALGLEIGLLREDGVEDGVGDLIAQLVGMSLGHRLAREQIGRMGVGHSSASFRRRASCIHREPWMNVDR